MFHPSKLKWTRNLLVSSSFGLQLHPNLQENIPAFRDSQQTSQFAAGLLALGHISEALFWDTTPRVFEIGRNGPVDLSTATASTRLHPVATAVTFRALAGRRTFLVLIALGCFVALLFFVFPFLQTLVSEEAKDRSLTRELRIEPGNISDWSRFYSCLELPQHQHDKLVTFLKRLVIKGQKGPLIAIRTYDHYRQCVQRDMNEKHATTDNLNSMLQAEGEPLSVESVLSSDLVRAIHKKRFLQALRKAKAKNDRIEPLPLP